MHVQGRCSDIILKLFYEKCVQARGAIGGIFAYLDTQIPFVYVHLLACNVHMLTLIVACDFGVATSRWIQTLADPAVDPAGGTLVKLVQVIVVPFFYNGCLEVARIMTDPLGKEYEDFPRHAYHHYMRQEAQAFHSTMEQPTHAASAVVAQLSAGRKAAFQVPGMVRA